MCRLDILNVDLDELGQGDRERCLLEREAPLEKVIEVLEVHRQHSSQIVDDFVRVAHINHVNALHVGDRFRIWCVNVFHLFFSLLFNSDKGLFKNAFLALQRGDHMIQICIFLRLNCFS